jgi:hypothetical protein
MFVVYYREKRILVDGGPVPPVEGFIWKVLLDVTLSDVPSTVLEKSDLTFRQDRPSPCIGQSRTDDKVFQYFGRDAECEAASGFQWFDHYQKPWPTWEAYLEANPASRPDRRRPGTSLRKFAGHD